MALKIIIPKKEAEKYFADCLIGFFIDSSKPITNLIGIDIFVSSDEDLKEAVLFDDELLKRGKEEK